MAKEQSNSIYRRALLQFGLEGRLDILVEEAAEMIVAVNHLRRGRISFQDLLEECMDVVIVIRQLEEVFPKEMADLKAQKLQRLEAKLQKGDLNVA